jgi:hypothetical protein
MYDTLVYNDQTPRLVTDTYINSWSLKRSLAFTKPQPVVRPHIQNTAEQT